MRSIVKLVIIGISKIFVVGSNPTTPDYKSRRQSESVLGTLGIVQAENSLNRFYLRSTSQKLYILKLL